MKRFNDFTRIYAVSKTLRFEAKPVGATLHNLIANGLLEHDEHRAESYVRVKKLIDEYHKAFIDETLASGCLAYEDYGKGDSLKEYFALYSSENRERRLEKFKTVQNNLREQIVKN